MAGSRGPNGPHDGAGASGAGGPTPDGHHDDLDANELRAISIDIPSDASALDVDRERWLAEEALLEYEVDDDPDHPGDHDRTDLAGPNGPAYPGMQGPPPPRPPRANDPRDARRRRLSITAGVVLVSMLIVALSGAIGAWIVGPHASPTPAAPLAESGAAPGEIGGLIPSDIVLRDGDAPITAQSVRPAVIALVPDPCDECPTLLSTLAPQVISFGVDLVAVGSSDQVSQLQSLKGEVGPTRLHTLNDPAGGLRSVYGLTGITLLLVRNDGVVVDVVRDPTPTMRLESALVDLVPGVGLGT